MDLSELTPIRAGRLAQTWEVASGFPFARWYRGGVPLGMGPGSQVLSGVDIGRRDISGVIPATGAVQKRTQRLAIPVQIAWRGFAADTLIFAGVWLVLLWIPGAVRRRVRRRRGHCPACGYDLCRDLVGGCPECGWNRASPPVLGGNQ